MHCKVRSIELADGAFLLSIITFETVGPALERNGQPGD
jgi:hypothetical protein